MKLTSLYHSLFSRKTLRPPGRSKNESVLNEYSEYHEYSTVDYGSIGVSSCSQSSQASQECIKHIVVLHRMDGYMKLKAVTETQLISETIDTSRYSAFLSSSVVDLVEVRGVVTDSLLRWLSASRVVTVLQIEGARIECSFPLLTDRILHGWCSTGLPRRLLLHQVETSFTIHGIRHMIEAALVQRHSFSWSFGRICSNAENSIREMRDCQKINTSLQVLQVHRSYIHVISDSKPKLYVFFYTSKENTSTEEWW